MSWIYHQKTGQIFDGATLIGVGYSGFGEGLNNPGMEGVKSIGPIPAGQWRIIRWDDHHGDKGPVVAVLQPVDHDAHGRTDFLIHGDNSLGNHSASHGCIIAGPAIRSAWRKSGDLALEVVA
jgi:hypothetical protein